MNKGLCTILLMVAMQGLAQEASNALQNVVVSKAPDIQMPAATDPNNSQVASLELLMPIEDISAPISRTLETLLSSDEIGFVKLLDKMQRDLSIAQEAIETERRSKDALELQLKDLQIQINALTELVTLKDHEITAMLHNIPKSIQSNQTETNATWDIIPDDILLYIQQAGENRMILLLVAIIIASITMYLWDTFTGNRSRANEKTSLNDDTSSPLTPALQDVDTKIALGLYDEAIQKLDKLLTSQPGNFNLLYKLCQVYVKDNQKEVYRQRIGRISQGWKQKYPDRWEQLQDLYELAWPMYYSSEENLGDTYEGDPPSDPIQTKLDLARAYLDIGDHENSVSILEEVLLEGNKQQSATAKMLLDNIKR